MKKLVLLAGMMLAVVMFSSCIGTNHMNYNALSQTEVVLSQSNFNVVGTAEGSYSVSYIFGLGGTSKTAMRENAVQQMFKNANLRGSQTIINVSYSTSRRNILGIYVEKTVTAYGTIIEFK
jgi:hypothetical protein